MEKYFGESVWANPALAGVGEADGPLPWVLKHEGRLWGLSW